MSCICGYLHFTRDLQYESFYLSQYILQFITYKKGAPKGALIGLLDITYLILSYKKRHYLYIELFRITFLQCEVIDYILLHVQNEPVRQS